MLRLLTTALFVLILPAVATAAGTVKLEDMGDSIAVMIDGKEFTNYHKSTKQPKPYFWPVLAPDGVNVSRSLEAPEDHPHHKGIWCAIDEVNEHKFWAEKAKIENVAIQVTKWEGNPAQFRLVNHWLAADGQPLIKETVTVTIYANRRIDYDLVFTAGDKPVTFDDTKEGLFGIRMADELREKQGGTIANAEGMKGEKDCWGKESKWVDYVGQINGSTYGVALFDDPANFRKSRYHVRSYGLFTISPFGQKAYTNGMLPENPLTIQPGKSIRLRYGLYIHEGDAEQGHVAEVYESFRTKGPKS